MNSIMRFLAFFSISFFFYYYLAWQAADSYIKLQIPTLGVFTPVLHSLCQLLSKLYEPSTSHSLFFIIFFLSFLWYFSYEWGLPFHMSLSTQYTVAVRFGNLQLGPALVPCSGAIITPLSEKTWFLHIIVCRFVYNYNCIRNRSQIETTLFWTKLIYFIKMWKKIRSSIKNKLLITIFSSFLIQYIQHNLPSLCYNKVL